MAVRLGVQDLVSGWRLAVATVLLIALPFQGFLLLDGLARGGNSQFELVGAPGLLVQDAGGVGEIYGSRIPAAVEDELIDLGASPAIPEIHSIAGTSIADAVLLRGVDVERYTEVEAFEMLEGRALRPGDPDRSAMIGATLAESVRTGAGGAITLRGKEYDVVGVFTMGTYADNEAWVSIRAAQALLGWGDEVSLFVVDEGGPLAEGESLDDGLIVVRRGEVAKLGEAWNPIGALMRLAAAVIVIAGGLILATLLWRLAWLRRRELAILRAIGLPRRIHAGYLGAQAAVIAALGLGLGLVIAVFMAAIIRFDTAQLVIEPQLTVPATLRMLGGGVIFGLAGAVLPFIWMLRTQPAHLLRRQ